jgi:hypothetical protein
VGLTRAVLVVSAHAEMPRRYVLDAAAAMGIVIAAVIDVEHVRQAHHLVGAGQADLIVYCGDLPTVRRLALAPAHGAPGHISEATAVDDHRSALRFRRPRSVA